MNMWLLAIGVLGILGSGVWYAVLLRDCSPGVRVAFFTKGDIPQRSIYLWLLVVMLSESVAVNSFDGQRSGVSIIGGVVVAFGLSELGRWWHNRGVSGRPAP
jgi:hypothetical protein